MVIAPAPRDIIISRTHKILFVRLLQKLGLALSPKLVWGASGDVEHYREIKADDNG